MIRFFFAIIFEIFYLIFTTIFLIPLIFLIGLISKKSQMKFSQVIIRYWGRSMFVISGCKVEIVIKEKEIMAELVKKEQPVIVVSNHQSNFDPLLIIAYCPKFVGFLAKKELGKIPGINIWMKLMGSVFIDRSSKIASFNSLSNVKKEILKKNRSFSIFPEGTRRNSIGKFKRGAFKLAKDLGIPIIPITIVGSKDMLKNKKIKFIVDKPIETKNLDKDGEKEVSNMTRNIIIKNHEEYQI